MFFFHKNPFSGKGKFATGYFSGSALSYENKENESKFFIHYQSSKNSDLATLTLNMGFSQLQRLADNQLGRQSNMEKF